MKLAKVVCTCALLACSAVAGADTVTITWDANPLNPSPGVAPMQFQLNGTPFTVSPSRYHGTVVGTAGYDPTKIGDGTGIPEGIFTYCYDLGQYFWGTETVTYNVVAGSVGVTSSTLAFLGAVNQQNPAFGN